MRTHPAALPVGLLALAALLGGCAAEPSPAASPQPLASPPPAAPAQPSETPSPAPVATGPLPLADLIITPDALGPHRLGELLDSTLASWDPEGCAVDRAELPVGHPGRGRWIPAYEPVTVIRGGEEWAQYPVEPWADDSGALAGFIVRSPNLATDTGIRIGSPAGQVQEAYPEAEREETPGADVYVTRGDAGALVIEVAQGGQIPWMDDGRVWNIRVAPKDRTIRSAAYGDELSFCI